MRSPRWGWVFLEPPVGGVSPPALLDRPCGTCGETNGAVAEVHDDQDTNRVITVALPSELRFVPYPRGENRRGTL